MSAGTFVDSNVFLYAEALDDPRHGRAVALLRELSQSRAVVISPQVIGEVFMCLRRDAGVEAARAQMSAMRQASILQPLDDRTTDHAARIMTRFGFDYWDSQVLAAAIVSGASYLITEDLQDGQVIDGVTIVNPFREDFDLSAL
jgi:predicted nucleic acid-binding protein